MLLDQMILDQIILDRMILDLHHLIENIYSREIDLKKAKYLLIEHRPKLTKYHQLAIHIKKQQKYHNGLACLIQIEPRDFNIVNNKAINEVNDLCNKATSINIKMNS